MYLKDSKNKSTCFFNKAIKNIIIFLSKNWIFLIIFLFFIFIFVQVPPVHDTIIMETLSMEKNNLWEILSIQFASQEYFAGRFFFGFFIDSICCYFPYGINFYIAFIITMIIFLTAELVTKNNRNLIAIFAFTLFIFVSKFFWNSPYLYAGSGYLPPLLFVLLFFLLYKKFIREKKINLIKCLLLGFLAFNMGNWLEHTGFAFSVMFFLWNIIELWHHKKIDYYLLVSFFACLGGFSFALFSTIAHGTKSIPNLMIINKVFRSKFLSFYSIVIFNNRFLFAIASIVAILAVLKKKICLILKSGYILFWLSYSVLFLGSLLKLNLSFLGPLISPEYFPNIAVPFWLIYLASFFIPIFYSNKVKSLTLLYLTAILSVIPIFLSSYLSERTLAFFLLLFLIIIVALFADVIKENKINIIFVYLLIVPILFVKLINLGIFYKKIGNVQKVRNEIFAVTAKKQALGQWNYDDYLILPAFSVEDFTYAPNYQVNSAFYPYFLKRYKLNKNTKVAYDDGMLHWGVDCDLIKPEATFVKVNLPEKERYLFKYLVAKSSGELLFVSEFSDNNVIIFNRTSYPENIAILVVMKDIENGKEKTVDCTNIKR